MARSSNLIFPFEEDFQTRSLRRAETPNDALASAMRCFLLTQPGQRRGNMIGSFLTSLKHKLIPSTSLPTFEEQLKTELTEQFKEVVFHEVKLEQTLDEKVSSLKVNITFSSPVSEISQLSLEF